MYLFLRQVLQTQYDIRFEAIFIVESYTIAF